MIAAVIMGVIMMAFVSMQSNQQKSQSTAQALISRNMLQLVLQANVVNPVALQKTLQDTTHAGNVALKNCLQPSGASCQQTSAPVGFVLYDDAGTAIAGEGASAPILYDDAGARCPTASAKCIFQIFTTFNARCPAASPCANPSVTAVYTLQVPPQAGTTPLKTIQSQSIPVVYNGGGGSGLTDTANQAIPNWPNNVTCTSPAGNSAVLHMAKLQPGNASYHAGYVKAESGGDSSYIWFTDAGVILMRHWADGTSDAILGCPVGANISTLRTTN